MNAIPPLLDHLVLATPDLGTTVADFTRRTGVTPVPDGAHPGPGTRNHPVGLGRPQLSGDHRPRPGATGPRRSTDVRCRPAGPTVLTRARHGR
ncbi:VOC family protein [Streptomyces eurythermus]|uniref:VOC family protein n=1 Tax=Streptomyces eurythermus TaxID=42237 RepID=UPI0036997BD7